MQIIKSVVHAFTSENALLKLIYCACQKVLEKWNQPMRNWALIISQLQIYFDGRLNLGLMSALNQHVKNHVIKQDCVIKIRLTEELRQFAWGI